MAKKKDGGERFRDIAQNRKAFHDFEILERVEAGLVLMGSEVKGLRDRGANIREAHAEFRRGEAWLVGAHIAEFAQAGGDGHDPRRARKLLLHRREIESLASRVAERGLAVVPLRLYFKDGRAKLEIALVRGKAHHDRRHDIAARDAAREMARVVRGKRPR
jgi:SsrA-binding protein